MKRLVSIAVAVMLTCMAIMVNTAYSEHDSLTGGNEQDNGTEFHVVDDLYVGGWNGTWNDPDVEIYGFSMFGSTTAYNNRWGDWANLQSKMPTTSTGAVVILGDLVVGSTAYFHRSVEFHAISTFTAGAYFPQYSTVTFVSGSSVTYGSAQNIYINDGSTDQVLAKDSDGSLKWADVGSLVSGDNLGNHIATRTLDMAGYDIIRIKELSLGLSENVKISSATTQFGGEGAGVYISTNVQVNGQLYVGTTTVNGQLNVTGNAIIGNDISNNSHTINGAVTVHANPESKKLMQIDDGTNVVAYFRKK